MPWVSSAQIHPLTSHGASEYPFLKRPLSTDVVVTMLVAQSPSCLLGPWSIALMRMPCAWEGTCSCPATMHRGDWECPCLPQHLPLLCPLLLLLCSPARAPFCTLGFSLGAQHNHWLEEKCSSLALCSAVIQAQPFWCPALNISRSLWYQSSVAEQSSAVTLPLVGIRNACGEGRVRPITF